METINSPTGVLTPVATLLLCPLCDKPFTKEPQYKRHITYCRKTGCRKRPRSCRACNLSKIKCNSCDPCHQCVRKGIECIFDQKSRRNGQEHQGKEANMASTVQMEVSDASTSMPLEISQFFDDGTQGPSYDFDNTLFPDDTPRPGDFGLCHSPQFSRFQCSLGKDQPDMNLQMLSDRVPFPTTFQTTQKEDDHSLSLFNSLFNNTSTIPGIDFPWDDTLPSGKQLHFPPPPTHPTTLAQLFPNPQTTLDAHFTKNPVKEGIHQVCATMITDLIYAYPLMMTRRETLPPFIHSYSPSSPPNPSQPQNPSSPQNSPAPLPKNLTSCMAIAQLFASRTPDTHALIWTTIRTEMRHLRAKGMNGKADVYEAMSALQACLLYLLIRVVDGGLHGKEDDWEMLWNYGDVCLYAIETSNCCHTDPRDPNLGWKEWILMESEWRIAGVWFLVGLIYNTRTGRPCFIHDNFRELLLPCSRMEWEAKNEEVWKREHVLTSGMNRLRTFGELIDAQMEGSTGERLGVWNAGVDHLGMALGIAARMFCILNSESKVI